MEKIRKQNELKQLGRTMTKPTGRRLNIDVLLAKSKDQNASDVHISVSAPPLSRVHGRLSPLTEDVLTTEDTYNLVKQVLNEKQFEILEEVGEFDCSYSVDKVGRFRVNAYKQRNSYSMALRLINFAPPDMSKLGLPQVITTLCSCQRGLILVTGPTGSGKSTTLASMIAHMNKSRNAHIITIEDPIEYLHKHGTCLINQREVMSDTQSFANALRASLREDPDIILVGEMRDPETIGTAITAAETGHLVLSTLHTIGAVKTVDRIIDSFPPYQQQQVKVQLSGMLEAVISQQLVPTTDGRGRVVALEIMVATPAIRNLIREGKTHQMQTILQTGAKYGMITMDKSLLNLYKIGKISSQMVKQYSVDQEYVARELGM